MIFQTTFHLSVPLTSSYFIPFSLNVAQTIIFYTASMHISHTVIMMFCVIFQYPMQTYGYGFIFSLAGYLGVNIVLTLVKTTGALIAVTGKY